MARRHARQFMKPISGAKFRKALKNRRCVLVGQAYGGSTYQCGKAIYVDVEGSHYQMTGQAAIDHGYNLKQRNKGYGRRGKHSYKGHR